MPERTPQTTPVIAPAEPKIAPLYPVAPERNRPAPSMPPTQAPADDPSKPCTCPG